MFFKYQNLRNRKSYVINIARHEFYSDFVFNKSGDPRELFAVTKKLLTQVKESPFSEHCNRLTLANELGAYFKKKISDNRFELNAAATVHNCSTLTPPTSSLQPSSSSGFFSSFELLSKVSVKKLWIPVSLKSSPCMLTQIHQIRNYFPKRNHVLLSNFFSSSNMLFIRLFLANTWEKSRRSPCLFPHKLL